METKLIPLEGPTTPLKSLWNLEIIKQFLLPLICDTVLKFLTGILNLPNFILPNVFLTLWHRITNILVMALKPLYYNAIAKEPFTLSKFCYSLWNLDNHFLAPPRKVSWHEEPINVKKSFSSPLVNYKWTNGHNSAVVCPIQNL